MMPGAAEESSRRTTPATVSGWASWAWVGAIRPQPVSVTVLFNPVLDIVTE